jgi:diguanylate cyclase (GGDEF)-like protein/PAS domain S-box-containing protein
MNLPPPAPAGNAEAAEAAETAGAAVDSGSADSERLIQLDTLHRLVHRAPAAKHAGARSAAGASLLGIWEHDLVRDVLFWSPETYRIFGIEAVDFKLSMRSFSSLLHPDDSKRMSRAFNIQPEPGVPAESEYRIVRPDGQVRVLYQCAESIFDDAGNVIMKIGVVIDITERKNAELDARLEAQELGNIVTMQQEIAAANLELGPMMQLVAERAQQLTGASGAVIELVEGDAIICRAASGTSKNQLGTRLHVDSSLSGVAVRSGATLVCDDTELDPRANLAVARLVAARSLVAAPLKAAGGEVIGVLKVMSERVAAFGPREMHGLQILLTSLGAVISQHRDAERLQRSEAQYRLLFESNPQPIMIHEWPSLKILAVNQAAVDHYGYSESRFLRMTLRDLSPPDERMNMDLVFAALTSGQRIRGTWRHVRRDGSEIDMEIVNHAIDFNGRPARQSLGNDVTERLRAERELARLNRAQAMLSASNEALIRAEDEASLLNEICRIATEIGAYRIAWVGLAMHDEARTIFPAAHSGSNTEYLHSLRMSWSDSEVIGHGPSARAIRSGAMVLIEDIEKDESFAPWLARARIMGYRGVRALPLRSREGGREADHHRTIGVMNLYSTEAVPVSQDEIDLLQQMADNLAFGLINLRSQEERKRIQSAVLKVAAAVSVSSGRAFFEDLVVNMADAVGAELAFIGRTLPDKPDWIRVIAALAEGGMRETFDYPINNSFSRELLDGEKRAVLNGFSEKYAGTALGSFGAQACVGQVLKNSLGQKVGILCVGFLRPLEQSDFITSTLQIFAARAAAELERQEADTRIRDQASLLDKAQDAIIVCDIDDSVTYWNKSAERLYGWTSEEALGKNLTELVGLDQAACDAATAKVLELGEWSGELTERHKGGHTFSIEGRWTLIRDDAGQPQSIFAINTDISARKAAEREIQSLAFYDPLTKLPNRLLLLDRLHHALAGSSRTRHHGALLFIDLDNFKTLNDTLGHDQGDLLLRKVAQRLQECVRESDTLARLGGDEFVVMLESLSENSVEAIEQARAVGEKTLEALNKPYQFAGYRHHSTSSIGITLFNDRPDNINDLLKRADLAMYQAKAAGRNTLRFFDPQMQQLATARVTLEADLRNGLLQQEFVLHYQPQVGAGGGIIGVEALVRWHHARRGLVSPLDFIPFAEESGLILPLGMWVLETACAQLKSWSTRPEARHLQVAVNVSARQFRHPDFVPQVLALLDRAGVAPHSLKLELTESLLLDNVEDTIVKMTMLKDRGVAFALDDFGTGYSSLSYLKRLPLDQLKIDQSFVRDVLTDPNDAAIARTVVALAHSLGLTVMAEGVESEAQRDFLSAHQCDAYQGFLFSRPLPIAQLEDFLFTFT